MKQMSNVEIVDDAIDRYVVIMRTKHGGLDPTGFQCDTLAHIAGTTREDMGHLLQQHRQAAGTRYVVACQGYGRAARWMILAKPGSDPKLVRQARRDQSVWIASDMAARFDRDIRTEIDPALRGTAADDIIKDAVDEMAAHTAVALRRIHKRLDKLGV